MEERVRVCPRCGDPQIKEDTNSVNGWSVPKSYSCEAEGCGYAGAVCMEISPAEVDEFRRVIAGK